MGGEGGSKIKIILIRLCQQVVPRRHEKHFVFNRRVS